MVSKYNLFPSLEFLPDGQNDFFNNLDNLTRAKAGVQVPF